MSPVMFRLIAGSGKTYTVMGPEDSRGELPAFEGLLPRVRYTKGVCAGPLPPRLQK